MEPMKGKWASSRVDLGYTKFFAFLRWQQYSSYLVTVFLGTQWCSIKHIEAPYMFDWEHGIALLPMQGIRALTPAEGDVSWDFSNCTKNLGYILELQRGWHFESPLGSMKSGFLSSKDGHLRKLN